MKDDFITRDGRLVFDSLSFATSWQVGGRKACKRQVTHRRVTCNSMPHRKARDKMCKVLRSEMFSSCREKLNPDIYFKWVKLLAERAPRIRICFWPSSCSLFCSQILRSRHVRMSRQEMLLPVAYSLRSRMSKNGNFAAGLESVDWLLSQQLQTILIHWLNVQILAFQTSLLFLSLQFLVVYGKAMRITLRNNQINYALFNRSKARTCARTKITTTHFETTRYYKKKGTSGLVARLRNFSELR